MTAAISRVLADPRRAGEDNDTTPPARLSLALAESGPAFLDGAWWPRSRDLTVELAELAGVLDGRWGRVTRVTVNPEFWPVVPRKVPARGHTVHVGWFAEEQDPHALMVLSYRVGRLDLLVVPPETGPAAAARLMSAAAARRGAPTASGLIADERAAAGAEDDHRGEDEWASEGGAGGRSRRAWSD